MYNIDFLGVIFTWIRRIPPSPESRSDDFRVDTKIAVHWPSLIIYL